MGTKTKKATDHLPQTLFEELEPRLLLSADLNSALFLLDAGLVEHNTVELASNVPGAANPEDGAAGKSDGVMVAEWSRDGTRAYLYDNNFTDVSIPDGSGGTGGGWVYSPLTTSGASATITSVNVYYEIIHSYIGDLQVDIESESTNYVIRDQEGGSANDIAEWVYDIHVFDGESVNQNWNLWAQDYFSGDTGYIDYVAIYVYYSSDYIDLYDDGDSWNGFSPATVEHGETWSAWMDVANG
ncbi:MAG: proprotein convertase P-domain-containing protein, partial [Phycisphaerae bacterium]|nr:proprotein convertase P-domain-containing protein [Phycisphaerae bacterium]